MEVVPQVLGDPLLRRHLYRQLAHQVINTPHVEGYAFAKVTQHDLQVGKLVEQSGADQPQRLGCGLTAEIPNGAVEPTMPFVGLCPRRYRQPRCEDYAKLKAARWERS